MVSMLASSAVDRGFDPWSVKPKTIKFVFVASPLSTQQKEKEQRRNQNNVSIRGLFFQ